MKDQKEKRVELEQSEKRLASVVAERDREMEREKGQNKNRIQLLEQKLANKKEKIKELIFDY